MVATVGVDVLCMFYSQLATLSFLKGLLESYFYGGVLLPIHYILFEGSHFFDDEMLCRIESFLDIMGRVIGEGPNIFKIAFLNVFLFGYFPGQNQIRLKLILLPWNGLEEGIARDNIIHVFLFVVERDELVILGMLLLHWGSYRIAFSKLLCFIIDI